LGLQIGVAHLRSLGLLVLLVGFGLPLQATYIGSTGPAMEPDIPSELDITDSGTHWWAVRKLSTELQGTLVLRVIGACGGDSVSKARILAVLREGIVQGSNLTLCIAVFLLGIGHVVLFTRKKSRVWHARGESTCYVGGRECLQRG